MFITDYVAWSAFPMFLPWLSVYIIAYLLGFSPTHARLDLPQHLAHEQNAIDEHAICWSLDLEVAEECVRAEEGKNLV
jgi:hypothetical protein